MSVHTPTPAVLQLRSSAGLYGADRMVLALNAGLARCGIRSRLLSISNYRLDHQPVHEAGLDGGQDVVLLACRGRLDLQTVATLVAQIDDFQATALHVHDYKSAFYAWLATRKRPRVKLVATLHGWVEGSHALRLYTRLELALLRRFEKLVVVSSAQITRLAAAGIPLSRIARIDNGITLGSAAKPAAAMLREELGLQGASRIFAAVGRLSPEKNLAMLIDTFAAVVAEDPCARLLLAGDGSERDALQQQVSQLRLQQRVLFLGKRSDMDDIYSLVDCLVLPSLSEGMPLVVLEAMARGIPVIASAVGEVPRLLANTECGTLVPAGDTLALRTALVTALAQPKRHDLKAVAHVRAHHCSESMARQYVQMYQQLGIECRDRQIA